MRAMALDGRLGPAQKPGTRYGHLTIQAWRAHKEATGEDLDVWLEDMLVTELCDAAHDVEGWVQLLAPRIKSRGFDVARFFSAGVATWDGRVHIRVVGNIRIAPKGLP